MPPWNTRLGWEEGVDVQLLASQNTMAALIGGILSGPRPLTFTFAGGARRVAAATVP